MGCRSCEIACAVEHSTSKELAKAILEKPRPRPRIRVLRVGPFSVPMRCQHCIEAPCARICPTRAISRTPEGFVIVNPIKCIGCAMCVLVCPFGHPVVDDELRTMVKCDFCRDRVSKGLPPACVEACPTGALLFGTVEEVTKYVARRRAREIIESKRVELEGLVVYTPPSEERREEGEAPSLQRVLEPYERVSWVR